jgi:hypothetical protein
MPSITTGALLRRLRGRLACAWWAVAAAVVRRLATAEMRRAALLLGMDIGLNGARRRGLLAHLREFDTGLDLGRTLRFGDERDRRQATEVFALERLLYR